MSARRWLQRPRVHSRCVARQRIRAQKKSIWIIIHSSIVKEMTSRRTQISEGRHWGVGAPDGARLVAICLAEDDICMRQALALRKVLRYPT